MSSVLHPMSSLAPEPARPEPPTFREARDLLLELDDRYVAAKTTFVWPRPETFNWALDWFDAELAAGEHGARTALKVIGETVETRTFAELSRAVVAARQRPALDRREARRPAPDDARRDAGAVGDDARRDEARPRAHSGDAAARRSRHRRPDRARQGEISGRARAGRGEVRRRAAEVERIAVGETPHGWRAFASLIEPERPLPAGRADAGRRADAALFHLGHHRALEARRAQPRELSDRASVDHVRARPQAGRRSSQHLLARLGEARLVERVRAVERGSDGRRARRAVRAARRARRPRRARGDRRSARRRPSGGC